MSQPAQRVTPPNQSIAVLKPNMPSVGIEYQRFFQQICQILSFQGRLSTPSAQTVGASPYSYRNTTTNDQTVIVQGGTVSKVEFSRDNTTFVDCGTTAGMFWLSPNDYLRITYTVVPTVTTIVR